MALTSRQLIDEQSAARCHQKLRDIYSDSEFGYIFQALAGHVLLRLGYKIQEINATGHPDIVAHHQGQEVRLEIKTQVHRARSRLLTQADYGGLLSGRGTGYFGLLVPAVPPKWIMVDATKLSKRKGETPQAVLSGIKDHSFSEAWTSEMTNILSKSCRLIQLSSFSELRKMALDGIAI